MLLRPFWVVTSETVVWIQVTGEMQGSQGAMIHRASSSVAPRVEKSQHRPLSGSLTAKAHWKAHGQGYAYTKNTERDNDLTAKQKVECNLTTAAMRNLITSFDYLHFFFQLCWDPSHYLDYIRKECSVCKITGTFLYIWKETNTFSQGTERYVPKH